MDTSEQYIKMCEKAEELQEIWEPQPFDNFCYRHHREDAPWWWSKLDRFGEINKKRDIHIWLPRQDQLQEMLKVDYDQRIISIWEMERFLEFYKTKWKIFETMEQLWLAFVMKEKYGKIWDGKKWIKGGQNNEKIP